MKLLTKSIIRPDGSRDETRHIVVSTSTLLKLELREREREVVYTYTRSLTQGELSAERIHCLHRLGLRLSLLELRAMPLLELRELLSRFSLGRLRAQSVESLARRIQSLLKDAWHSSPSDNLGLRFEINSFLENGKVAKSYEELFLDLDSICRSQPNLKKVLSCRAEDYLRQRFQSLSSLEPQEWELFRLRNRSALNQVLEVHSGLHPKGEVAQAWRAGDFEGALNALQTFWNDFTPEEKSIIIKREGLWATRLDEFGGQFDLGRDWQQLHAS